MFAERDKHYPSRSGQTSLATVVTNITKSVTKNNFKPITYVVAMVALGITIDAFVDGRCNFGNFCTIQTQSIQELEEFPFLIIITPIPW